MEASLDSCGASEGTLACVLARGWTSRWPCPKRSYRRRNDCRCENCPLAWTAYEVAQRREGPAACDALVGPVSSPGWCFMSFGNFELPLLVDSGTCSVEWPCFPQDHIEPPGATHRSRRAKFSKWVSSIGYVKVSEWFSVFRLHVCVCVCVCERESEIDVP